MNYTTQMDAARKGLITREMERVAEKERMTPEDLRQGIADGRIVIPANKNHTSLYPCGIGQGMQTKINVNLGVSNDCCDINGEMEKVRWAINLKA
ncbi:MAG: phosphomethylpyrimidine synthase ThiC, partial [Peptococcaceae bacterium]|nr:phosphomethylpyrimidine synthase ThiC [Peptococcaceae bacterium]